MSPLTAFGYGKAKGGQVGVSRSKGGKGGHGTSNMLESVGLLEESSDFTYEKRGAARWKCVWRN